MARDSYGRKERLLSTIEWQRHGFVSLGSSFYDALARELADAIRSGGPAWTVLEPFADEPIEAAYILRLFAGIHRAALSGSVPTIAEHFPSTGGDSDAHQAMTAVNLLLSDPPEQLLEALAVPPQTNEVGRSAALASGLLVAAEQLHMPIRLREIGTSGGLNLRLDSYWYEQDGTGWGNARSPVRFVNQWSGGSPPFSTGATIADRRGCDLHPIDATSPEGSLTLLSYIWPEPEERFTRLRDAVELARSAPVAIDRADAATWLRAQLATAELGTAMIVMHSVMWQYLDQRTQESIRTLMERAGTRATPDSPLAWLRLEPNSTTYAPAELKLTLWNGPEPHEQLIATSGMHGGPLNWQI